MSTTIAVMLSRPPASLAAATSASAACWGPPTVSSGRMTSSGSSPVRPSEQIRNRSPPTAGSSQWSDCSRRGGAEGAGDDISARVGAGLLTAEHSRQDELLDLRMVDRHLHDAVGREPVDPRVAHVEHHQVIAAGRLEPGQPGHRGPHPARRLRPADDDLVRLLERVQHRLGEQRAQLHAAGERLDREPAGHVARAVAAHAVRHRVDRRHGEVAVLVYPSHAAHRGGDAVAEADHVTCRER